MLRLPAVGTLTGSRRLCSWGQLASKPLFRVFNFLWLTSGSTEKPLTPSKWAGGIVSALLCLLVEGTLRRWELATGLTGEISSKVKGIDLGVKTGIYGRANTLRGGVGCDFSISIGAGVGTSLLWSISDRWTV